MQWTSLDTWIVIAGMLAAAACALPGNFLVLRRMSMMGDAISHAVLPGLATAFLLTGSRASLPMFLGAAIVGVLTAVFTQWVHSFGKVEQNAAMGVVFTALFALGLIIIVRAADAVDLDPGCVLYGSIELVPLDVVDIGGTAIPRAVVVLGSVFLVNLLFVVVFFKELKISTFDPALATTLGISATLMHYLLMVLVAITAVACFESVGSILVIAMLIVPPAAAHLLTERLHTMVIWSLILGVAGAASGHWAAMTVPSWFGFSDTTTAGMMAVMMGVFFVLAMVFAPRQGLIARLLHRSQLSLRIAREDVLGMLYRVEEMRDTESTGVQRTQLHGAIQGNRFRLGWAVRTLLRRGALNQSGGEVSLTSAGRDQARGLVRSHRLWEAYLARMLNLPSDHVHTPAERLEHVSDPEVQQHLAEDAPPTDPQGRQIPPQ